MAGMESPASYVPKDRYLSDLEIQAFFNALEESNISLSMRLCIEWQMLTVTRPTEARLTTWSEIDEQNAILNIPAKRSMNNKPHTVYLSHEAMEVLEKAKAFTDEQSRKDKGALLFPGKKDGKPTTLAAIARAVKRLLPEIKIKLRELTKDENTEMDAFTPHDIRRTGATIITKLGYSWFIAGLILNHTDQSVTGIYDQNDYAVEMRNAWRALGERIAAIKTGKAAQIIPINQKKYA